MAINNKIVYCQFDSYNFKKYAALNLRKRQTEARKTKDFYFRQANISGFGKYDQK